MNQLFIERVLQVAHYVRKPNTISSYAWESGCSYLPKTLTISKGDAIFTCAHKGRNLQTATKAQLKGGFTQKEESLLKQNKPYKVSTQIWELVNFPLLIGYGSIGITGTDGKITSDSDTGNLVILYGEDKDWNRVRIYYGVGMLDYKEDVASYINSIILEEIEIK